MVAGAGASLYVPAHVELELFAWAHAPGHHRVAHAVTTGAVHSRVGETGVVQVSPDPAAAPGVVVLQTTRAPRVGRGVAHPGLRPRLLLLLARWCRLVVVAQPRRWTLLLLLLVDPRRRRHRLLLWNFEVVRQLREYFALIGLHASFGKVSNGAEIFGITQGLLLNFFNFISSA